jgi:hypothetical protein
MVNNGTIEGFVYWDTSVISHVPAGDCSGLAVTVAMAQSSAGPYTSLATLSDNFKYVGQVKQFLVGGKNKVYDVCTYGYDKVPVGLNLRVTVNVTSPTAFSPASVPQNSIISPINIINGQCNMLPRIVNPTASDLFSKWGTCQNMAYDVNFVMHTAPRSPIGLASNTPGSSGSQGGMLSATPQQGMLTPDTTQSAQQGTLGTLLGNRQTVAGRSGGVQNPGSKVELNLQPFPPRVQVTNADVIKMVKAGIAESVIVSSVQSSTKQFDLSPAGIQALQQAHVSPAVLAAMCDGSARCPAIQGNSTPATPGSKVELNPQPFPPRTAAGVGTATPGTKAGLTSEQMLASLKKPSPGSRAAVTPMKVQPPKPLKKITNPRLAEQNASIIAVLEQQRQAAETEASAMNASTRAIAAGASAHTPALAANIQQNTVQGLGPQKVQSSSTFKSQIAHAPAFNGIVLLCASDPSPRIAQVNGGQGHGTIFTPEAKYNFYTIVGCSFGPSRTGNSAYISAGTSFKANLNIDSWGENGITAHLDPWLAGVLDQDNVTLVVSPAVGQPIQQPGFRFYAARGMPRIPDKTPWEVPLAFNSLPQSEVKLSTVAEVQVGWDGLPQNATSAFPFFSFQGNPIAGWVFRYAYGHDDSPSFLRELDPSSQAGTYDCWINGSIAHEAYMVVGSQIIAQQHDCSNYFYFGDDEKHDFIGAPGADQWNLPLRPDFALSSYELYYGDTDASQLCGAWDDSSKNSGQSGSWDSNLTGANQITVSSPLYWCNDQEAWPFNRLNAQRQSSYGIAVWVWGPRCVDPLTGQPDTACMNKVKTILG